jgi:hypothetical protein
MYLYIFTNACLLLFILFRCSCFGEQRRHSISGGVERLLTRGLYKVEPIYTSDEPTETEAEDAEDSEGDIDELNRSSDASEHSVEDTNEDIKNYKCLLCNKEITETEFEYEDYFKLMRGHNDDTLKGYICFDCIKDQSAVNALKNTPNPNPNHTC